ncbi:MAG: VOC family protein [Pusillimonas sp.]|nr:VOC family protein [Pusillimonas sp.]MDX3895265.1 VOC family protein [Pusillimonas sp.]
MNISVKGLHHVAWRCVDAEETRHFYEDILGLPLAHVVKADVVPSTRERMPYVHIFFQFGDGSYIAFFDVNDGKGNTLHPEMPSWIPHFAMEVDTRADLLTLKKRLEDNEVDVIGVVDHHFIHSIYFFDPNGVRLEFTIRTETQQYLDDARANARSSLDEWTRIKNGGHGSGACQRGPKTMLS